MVRYAAAQQLLGDLQSVPGNSLDFVLLVTGAQACLQEWIPYLEAAIRALREGGVLFVQGVPRTLPEIGVYLDGRLRFKYWIAVESTVVEQAHGLPSTHAGILMFVRGERFSISRVRFPHQYCRACGKPLRDWGGKAHLMHPAGTAISDVWKDLPKQDNYTTLSQPALQTLFAMLSPSGKSEDAHLLNAIIGPAERLQAVSQLQMQEPVLPYHSLPLFRETEEHTDHARLKGLVDTVIQGDALDVLRRIPSESVDLAFADPPYNLDKAYLTYDDEKDRDAYLSWCNAWLDEYVRVLKPTGSLYVLNLPRWAMHHAAYLNQRLHFQNWIVWDALSEPRGKIMPAHYALLFYTKHPTCFTFNYSDVSPIDARTYCLRAACVRQRKWRGDDDKESLSDIWWDVHRIKHRRYRDYHPCQLPEALLERIIRLSTKPGDIVLDAMVGTGTAAIVAAKLGRHYIGIDLDEAYVTIVREKLAQVQTTGNVIRPSVGRPRPRYSKKALQLELQAIARQLGRLPTPDDVQQVSHIGLDAFLEAFPSWGKALKAAKLLQVEQSSNGKS